MIPEQKDKEKLWCISNTPQGATNIQWYHDQYKGQRCFIVGNGPSLNKCNLSFLDNEYSFGVNGIFYKTRECGFVPTFYVVEDGHVLDDRLAEIAAYEAEHKFTLARYADKFDESSRMQFLSSDSGFYDSKHYSYQVPRFSHDCSEVVYCGQSVTYINLQLAYYMGFTEVYLIGMDFSYSVPQSTKIDGCTFISQEDDPNHFHPDYFGKGKKWHDPKIDLVGLNYQKAKEVFENAGRKIYNATVGGKLEVFERVRYESLFLGGESHLNGNQVDENIVLSIDRLDTGNNKSELKELKYIPPVSSDWSTANDKYPPAVNAVFCFFSHCVHIVKDSFFGASGVGFALILLPLGITFFLPKHWMALTRISAFLAFGMLLLFVISFVGHKFREAVEDSRLKRRRDIYSLSSFCVDAMNQQRVVQSQLQQTVNLLQEENFELKSSLVKLAKDAEEAVSFACENKEYSNVLRAKIESLIEAEGVLRNMVVQYRNQYLNLSASFQNVQASNAHSISLLEECTQNDILLNRKVNLVIDNNLVMRQQVETVCNDCMQEVVNRANEVVASFESKQQAYDKLVGKVQRQADCLEKEIQSYEYANGFNGIYFHNFKRKLNSKDVATIRNKWCKPLDVRVRHGEVAYWAHKICVLEDLSIGRFAAHTQDILARAMVAKSVKKEKLHILEIGSLFGIALFAMYNICKNNFKDVHISSIDLFDGYYGGGSSDVLTGEPVSLNTFRSNMKTANIPEEDVTIIQGDSFDNAIVDMVKDTEINVLVVDGDHSYEGVANDVERYFPFVTQGGYIIIDDYNNPSWPDVDKYIDDNMRSNSSYELVAQGWKTVVFKKM